MLLAQPAFQPRTYGSPIFINRFSISWKILKVFSLSSLLIKKFVQRTIGGDRSIFFFFLFFFTSYDIQQFRRRDFRFKPFPESLYRETTTTTTTTQQRQLVRANLLVVVCATSNCMHDIRLLSANWKFLTTSVSLHKAQQRHGTFHVCGPDWRRANLTSMKVI